MIGLYGGSFDPIHIGHLNLAIEMMEKRNLQEIWFIPAQINPHKQYQQPPASAEHRLAMLQLAIGGIPQFKILDLELKKEGPSYTVDTITALLKEGMHSKFGWILGNDAALSFSHWRDPEEIIKMAELLIGCRSSCHMDFDAIQGNPEIVKAIQEGMTQTRVMDISSTDIRRRISEGKICLHMVPAKVLDYIYEHRLYLSIKSINQSNR